MLIVKREQWFENTDLITYNKNVFGMITELLCSIHIE